MIFTLRLQHSTQPLWRVILLLYNMCVFALCHESLLIHYYFYVTWVNLYSYCHAVHIGVFIAF